MEDQNKPLQKDEDQIPLEKKEEISSVATEKEVPETKQKNDISGAKPDRVVHGKISNQEGKLLINYWVIAHDKDLRSQEELGEITTTETGEYRIKYSKEKFGNKEKQRADIFIEVYRSDKKSLLGKSSILFNAPNEARIDLQVNDKEDDTIPEFQKIEKAILPLLGNLKVYDLVENEEHQDFTFISGETGINLHLIEIFVWCHKIEVQKEYAPLHPEYLYALIRTDFKNDVNDILSKNETSWKKAIQDAVEDVIIKQPDEKSLNNFLQQLFNLKVKAALTETTSNNLFTYDELFSLSSASPDEKLDIMKGIINNGSATKDLRKAIEENKKLPAELKKDVLLTYDLSKNLGNHLPLVKALKAKHSLTSLTDLGKLNKEQWARLLKQDEKNIPPFIPGKNAETKAKFLEQVFEKRFPTEAFHARMLSKNFEGAITKNDKKIEKGQKSSGSKKEEKKTKLNGEIKRFFEINPDFNIKKPLFQGTEYFQKLSKSGIDIEATLPQLQAMQRVFKLSPHYEDVNILMKGGIDSAQRAAAMGKDRFIETFAKEFVDDLDVETDDPVVKRQAAEQKAAKIYDKALGITKTTIAIKTYAAENANPTGVPAVMNSPQGNGTLQPAGTDTVSNIPELKELLGQTSYCTCKKCRSVYSPAAYLVDLLHFLSKQRPATTPASNETLLQHLIERRPEIENILLNCENSFTQLPYVDLVLEIVENAVNKELGATPDYTAQTTWEEEELGANAEHTVAAIYERLKTIAYPNTLPFDVDLETARIYLPEMGVSRLELMEKFYAFPENPVRTPPICQSPDSIAKDILNDKAIAAEALNLNRYDWNLITKTDFLTDSGLNTPDNWDYYGIQQNTGGDWVWYLTSAENFIKHTNIKTFAEAKELLDLEYINPKKELKWETNAESCDIKDVKIVVILEKRHLVEQALVRISPFIRLAKRMDWAFRELDLAFDALGVGSAGPDRQDLIRLSHVKRLKDKFNLPVENLVVFWGNINTTTYTDYLSKDQPVVKSLYHRLFLNKAVVYPPDAAFGENGVLPGHSIRDHKQTICAALQLTGEEFDYMINPATGIIAATELTLSLLSVLYRYKLLSLCLKVRLRDIISYSKLTGIAVTNPLLFIETFERFTSWKLPLEDLEYILLNRLDANKVKRIKDNELDEVLHKLKERLAQITPDNSQDVGSNGTAGELAEQEITNTLADLLKMDGEIVRTLLNITTKSFFTPQKENLLADFKSLGDNTIYDTVVAKSFRYLERISKIIEYASLSVDDVYFIVEHKEVFGVMDNTSCQVKPFLFADFMDDEDGYKPMVFYQLDKIFLYKALSQTFSGNDKTLKDLYGSLNAVEVLHELSGWDTDTINELKNTSNCGNDFTSLIWVKRFRECKEIIDKTNVSARDLFTWAKRVDNSVTPPPVHLLDSNTSRAIIQSLKAKIPQSQWPEKGKEVKNKVREKQRAALVDYLVTKRNYKHANQLYDYHLVDVEMSPCRMTTRIRLAIDSVQLFVNRCLLNLEGDLGLTENAIKEWEWMKNYRVWEANRKVFLYPENYIEPELRDDKTPFFKELENELRQNQLTDEHIENVFRNYLEKVNSVSRLQTAGVYEEKQTVRSENSAAAVQNANNNNAAAVVQILIQTNNTLVQVLNNQTSSKTAKAVNFSSPASVRNQQMTKKDQNYYVSARRAIEQSLRKMQSDSTLAPVYNAITEELNTVDVRATSRGDLVELHQKITTTLGTLLSEIESAKALTEAVGFEEVVKTNLYVFARTREIPHEYYFRRFVDNTHWTPWEKLPVNVEGDHLIPVVFNHRLYLFWPTFTSKSELDFQTLFGKFINVYATALNNYVVAFESIASIAQSGGTLINTLFVHIGEIFYKLIEDIKIINPLRPNESLDIPGKQVFLDNWVKEGREYPDGTKIIPVKNLVKKFLEENFVINIDSNKPGALDGSNSLNYKSERILENIVQNIQDASLNYYNAVIDFYNELIPKAQTEIQLSWAEYKNGKWSGKKTSNQSLKFYDVASALLDKKRIFNFYQDTTYPNGLKICCDAVFPPFAGSSAFFDIFKDDIQHAIDLPEWAKGFFGNDTGVPGQKIRDGIFTFIKALKDNLDSPIPVGCFVLENLHAPLRTDSYLVNFKENLLKIFKSLNETVIESISRAKRFLEGVPITTANDNNSPYRSLVNEIFTPEYFDNLHPEIVPPHQFHNQESQSIYFLNDDYRSIFVNRLNGSNKQALVTFYHPFTNKLQIELDKNGLAGIFNAKIQEDKDPVLEVGNAISYISQLPSVAGNNLVPYSGFDFSEWGAYSQYNWELYFHVPFLIATRLSQDQKFKEAMRWYHYIFNPTIHTAAGAAPQKYWITKQFHERLAAGYQLEEINHLFNNLNGTEDDTNVQTNLLTSIRRWRDDAFNPHAVARYRTTAFQKAVVMKYLDNLIAWGDYLFKQEDVESINEATQLYVFAQKILGERPQEIIVDDKASVVQSWKVFNESMVDAFSNVNIETLLPDDTSFFGNPVYDSGTGNTNNLTLYPHYFCIPPNEKLLRYWDTFEDRLFKIRHCQDIEGRELDLSVFGSAISPELLIKGKAAGLRLNDIINDNKTQIPPYRFVFMLQKAKEFCSDVISLGSALLTAIEKSDAEELSRIRTGIEKRILERKEEIQDLQVKDAGKQKEALEISRNSAYNRLAFYTTRLVTFMSPFEHASLQLKVFSSVLQNLQGAFFLASVPTALMPTFKGGFVTTAGAQSPEPDKPSLNLARAIGSAGAFLNSISEAVNTMGGYWRRAEEWAFQAITAQFEIDQLGKQITASEIKINIAEKEKLNLCLQKEDQKGVEEFLLTKKFTTKELYDWMVIEVSKTYFESYGIALDLAKAAQKCYDYEKGNFDDSNSKQFITAGRWESLRKGLLAGEWLKQDLLRMEASYYANNVRDIELTKHISVVMLHPFLLLELKETGRCEIDLPEELFDMDFPGHYFRRIKSISLTIPCIAGPYTSINCTLQLNEHRIRIIDELDDPVAFVDYNNVRVPFTSIATSSAQNDSGMFEVNFREERYLPFEGAGAISKWSLEIGGKYNVEAENYDFSQFDFDTISDVIIHVKYTAKQGRQEFKNDIVKRLDKYLKPTNGNGNFERLLSLKYDFPKTFHQLMATENGSGTTMAEMIITKAHFPYLFSTRGIICGTGGSSGVQVYIKPKETVDINVPDSLILTVNDGANDYDLQATAWNNLGKILFSELSSARFHPVNKWSLNITFGGLEKENIDDILVSIQFRVE